MTKQVLFYERAVPVSAQRHGDWSLEPRQDYAFAGHSNWVPLTAAEFAPAALEHTIVFLESGDAVQPVVILGLKADENRYLDEEGRWDAKYIPAFVRRYPFVFSKTQDEKKLILCLDEDYSGWNQEGRGQKLFNAEGEATEYLDKIVDFVKGYQRQFELTLAFCRKLKDLDLLEPVAARFQLPSGEKAQLTGFMAVSKDKLKALPGETLEELVKSEGLELIYAHLQSMRNMGAMLGRAMAKLPDQAAADEGVWDEESATDSDSPVH